MYQKPGKLKVEFLFKEPGKPELHKSRVGKRVYVDRHAYDFGMYVVWATSKRYALMTADQLVANVEFDTPHVYDK